MERGCQRELSVGLEPMRMAVSHVEQHEFVWIVSWTSEEYLRTRNPDFMLAGNSVESRLSRLPGASRRKALRQRTPCSWFGDVRSRAYTGLRMPRPAL
ncbi:YrhB domain-containing protein [Streptomyces sp. NPDC048254]|uniref:YrhB domain-containing protein n=1 Tax=Streptomyces sp. NPDC048254 TaxID=3365525 RepID=UPI003717A0FA